MPRGKQVKGTPSKSTTWRRSLFEHALEGIFRSTPEGRFLEVNPTLVRMLGYQSAEEVLALKLPDDLYVNPVERERLRTHYEVSGAVDGEELQWKKKNGEPIIVTFYARTLRDTRGHIVGYEGMVLDVTERKRTEAALQASEVKYRTIFAASPDFMYLTDSEGRLLDANPALLEWQELSLEDLRQRHFLDFFAGDNLAEVMREFAALRQGRLVRGLEVRVRNGQGEIRVFEVHAIPFQEPAGVTATLSVARDITIRKQAEARLQLLSRQLWETQEAERSHLARELHDEIGQTLTVLKINLKALKPVPERAKPYLQESLRLVDSILQEIRNLSLDLRPSQLDNLGLVDTLQWHVDRWVQRTGLVMHFAADRLQPRPSPLIETACFRVVQEALTNITRHAQARQVWIMLRQHDAALDLLIRDDGIGFDVDTARTQAAQGKGLGLLGMEERMRLMGGQLEIVAAPEKGTEIHVCIPLRPPQ
ncbi:MAG: PAS domain S-box protein [Deltaproteobacteria bacterium]|nr:PAS domain S-box protein [Deltaproteobacteria bacterium]